MIVFCLFEEKNTFVEFFLKEKNNKFGIKK